MRSTTWEPDSLGSRPRDASGQRRASTRGPSVPQPGGADGRLADARVRSGPPRARRRGRAGRARQGAPAVAVLGHSRQPRRVAACASPATARSTPCAATSSFRGRAGEIAAEIGRTGDALAADPIALDGLLRDDELRMMFLCCHPSLPRDARVALSLKTVGGFSVAEIARALLASEPADRAAPRAREAAAARRRGRVRAARRRRARRRASNRSSRSSTCCSTRATAPTPATISCGCDLCGEALRLARLVAGSATTSAPAAHALDRAHRLSGGSAARAGRRRRRPGPARASGSSALGSAPHRARLRAFRARAPPGRR